MNMRTADRLPPTPSLTPSPSPGHPLPQRHSSHTHRRNLSRPFHEAIDVPPQTDPLKVLRKIIDKRDDKRRPSSHPPPASPVKGPDSKATGAEKPPILIESIDFGSLSLEEFAKQAEGEDGKHRLSRSVDGQPQTQTQSQSIESYNTQRQRFQALHDAISSANSVLQSVESYLVSFQTDLGHVSAEIESLQSRSTALNSQLENRRNLERLLGPAVQNIIVSPASVQAITNGHVDRAFVKALAELEDRARYIDKVENSGDVARSGDETGNNAESSGKANTIKAIEDVKPLIEGLRVKAVEKIRDYLVAQIKTLRSPNINAQLIQQNTLLRYKEIFAYLHRNHAQLAADLTQAYVNTMRWYYSSLFQRYIQAMEAIKLFSFDRNDLIGVDPAVIQKSVFQTPRLTTHDPFTLGRRIDILRTHNNMAIGSQLAEADKTQHGIEVPFRNFTLALIDNISAEYSFLSEFFAPALSYHQISRRATETFEPVLSAGQVLVKGLVETCMDCLGILLCVRLNQHFAFELQRRRCPVADGWINGVNMMLWPRFQIVMDMHCDSLRKATASVATNSTRGAFLASSLLSGSGNGSGLSGSGGNDIMAASTAPHLFTQRFGQFLQGVLMLSSEAGDDEPVSVSLGRLRGEYDALVGKLSKACAGGDGKRRERFLVNNYSLVLTIISDTQGKLASEQKEHLTKMMNEAGGRR
ncbi:Vps52 / Sac2 family protein [Ascosphaera apis ARSEF 7405]|uniref:Vps52 / Sac2 family protein n=1 Tax=Ascosphaera apis ARSEF 7405 TaxID=392613 RepID=A0A162IEJ1_9EURO|nr:Vps52 / Sac2 family protein [Ascosphaera apis ARSEF 7405]